MTTSEAISCYTEIAEKVFSTSKLCWQDGSFKASAFEKAIGDAVEAKLGPGHRDDLMYDFNSSSSCKRYAQGFLMPPSVASRATNAELIISNCFL